MRIKYVMLRKAAAPAPEVRMRSRSMRADSPRMAVRVDFEEIAPRMGGTPERPRDVEALAPVFPMKLITPVAKAAAADPLTGGNTWGIGAVGADTSPYTGDGVVVAVLDTGIDANHAAFKGVALTEKNFTAESGDLNGHGTHVAGTIFGRAVNGTRIGVAPGVRAALIGKVLNEDGGGSDVLLQGIEWALANGANVISMSLGIDFPGYVAALQKAGFPEELATSFALEGYRANLALFQALAMQIAARGAFLQSTLLVAAAGNESRRDVNPDFVIGVSPPAVAEGIISVGALGPIQDRWSIAPFSNTGPRIAAPGLDIVSAAHGGGLVAMSGTSMAAPHVAGVAALWAEKLRKTGQLTPRIFSDRVVGSGKQDRLVQNFVPRDVGTGLVQAPQD